MDDAVGVDVLEADRDVAQHLDLPAEGRRPDAAPLVEGPALDELLLAIAPIFLGEGLRLFEGIDKRKVALEIAETIPSRDVTHLRYTVKKR